MFVPLQESAPVVDPSAASGVLSLLWVIIALPALGATVILLLGNTRTSRFAHLLGWATVLASFVIGPFPMPFVLNGFELGGVVIAVLVATHVTSEGESHWFEGVQLLAVYAVLGIAFFFA